MTGLLVKTGMRAEYVLARRYAAKDVLQLTGAQTVADLEKNVPPPVTAIISFGLCGGLAPSAQVGQAFIYDTVVTPSGSFTCDPDWRMRLFAAMKYYECHCWSSGEMNTADSVAQRAALFAKTNCEVIDDESYAVAEFAAARGLPFIGLRVVSDGAEDNLPPAVVSALDASGAINLEAVIGSVISNPSQIPALIQTAREYELSLSYLRTAAIQAGPEFQWR